MKKRIIYRIMLVSMSILMAVATAGCSVETSSQKVSSLVISEVVSLANSNSFVDPVLGQPDWIELFNNTDSSINLLDYTISEGSTNKYTFPDATLGAGEYMLVYCCSQPQGVDTDAYCTGFKLSKSGSILLLSSPEGVIQTLTVPELETDLAWGLASDGTYKYFIPTPGTANTTRSFATLEELKSSDTVPLKITEVLPDSVSEDAPYGWVELYNNGTEAIQLSDLYITENLSKPDQGADA